MSPESSDETPDEPDDLEPVLGPEEVVDDSTAALDDSDVDGGLESAEVAQETAEEGFSGGEGATDVSGDGDSLEAAGDTAADSAGTGDDKVSNGGNAVATARVKKPGEKPLPPKAKAKAKAQSKTQQRPAAADGPSAGRGYTASGGSNYRPPSPIWVPILMFGLWGLGLLLIILNYMELLPGTAGGSNGWYLIGGLVSILGGIVAATKYH